MRDRPDPSTGCNIIHLHYQNPASSHHFLLSELTSSTDNPTGSLAIPNPRHFHTVTRVVFLKGKSNAVNLLINICLLNTQKVCSPNKYTKGHAESIHVGETIVDGEGEGGGEKGGERERERI